MIEPSLFSDVEEFVVVGVSSIGPVVVPQVVPEIFDRVQFEESGGNGISVILAGTRNSRPRWKPGGWPP